MKTMFNFAAATAAAALMATTAVGQGSVDVRLVNNSGVTLYSFHATDTSNESWGDDLLGNQVLNTGQYVDLRFQSVYNCTYDLRFQQVSGGFWTDTVNICLTSTYTIEPEIVP